MPMPKVCRNKYIWLLVGLLCLSGCKAKKTQDLYTRLAWLKDLQEESGIVLENVDTLDALEKYGVIDTKDFDTSVALDRDFVAYTLVNLVGMKYVEIEIVDIEEAIHPKHIQSAVDMGYFELTNKKIFPLKLVDAEEAHALLHSALITVNNPAITFKEEINFLKDIPILHAQPLTFDSSSQQATLPLSTPIENYATIHWLQDGKEYIYDIVSYTKDDDVITVTLQDADLLNLSEDMELEGESNLDFSKAEFTFDNDETATLQNYTTLARIQNVKQKTINYKGYKILLEYGVTGISATITKPLGKAIDLESKLKMSGISVKYKFFSKRKSVDNAFFKVNLHTEESVAIKTGNYKSLYGDFSKIDPQNFLSSLSSFLKPKEEIETVDIPIGTIKIPLEASHIMTVKARLSIVLYATGQAYFVLSQDNMMGMEIRNGTPRFIKEFSHHEDHAIRADASVTAKLTFALDAVNVSLMDVGIETGAKAKMKTTVHLYDEDNNHIEEITSLPNDAVDALSIGNGNVLVCSDLNAYWILRLLVNSGNTLLGRFGFGTNIDILNENTGSMIGGTLHLENGQIKDHCTRTNREKKLKVSALPEKQQIKLSSYGLALKVGQSKDLQIVSYPNGYTANDFTFTSTDTNIATISNGKVYGNGEGSCRITITSKDEQYQIQVSVLVINK